MKIRKSSVYDPDFKQHLIDYDVYSHEYNYNDDDDSVYLNNWEKMNERLMQSQPSLLPLCFSCEVFQKFEKMNMQALTENKVMSKVFSIIIDTVNVSLQKNLWFENLKDLTDDFIIKAQLNFYDEAHLKELNKQIWEELRPYIMSLTNTVALCLLNFFMKSKGFNDDTLTCKNQALYDDALSAWGIYELQSYIDLKTAHDNKAYIITLTYHLSGLLIMYTTYAVTFKNSKHQIEYHMTQLNSFAMINNSNTFWQKATFLRNDQDLTEEDQKKLIITVNTKALNAENSEFDSST